MDWFLQKSGIFFNLLEAKPNQAIWGTWKDERLNPLYSTNKLEPSKLFEERRRITRPRSSNIDMGIGPSNSLLLKSSSSSLLEEMVENSLSCPENWLLESRNVCNDGRGNIKLEYSRSVNCNLNQEYLDAEVLPTELK
jgi:hypothetical protein